MSWDTDLLQEFIDDSFDVPLTGGEIRDLSTKAGFAEPDDAEEAADEVDSE